MATTIRVAHTADEHALHELDLGAWSANVTPAARDELRTSFFAPGCDPEDVLVADCDGTPAGYVQLTPPTDLAANGHVLEIRGLAVDPARQRLGIATLLLKAAADEASRRGVTRLTLRVLAPNTAARRLYAACGYVVEGVLRGEFVLEGTRVDDVLMALELPASSASVIG
ncbi:MAG: GNAT family N-acetyltransferase [Actinomycetota bacterium]|nr:GNAT family N-acetyltransferase [Actinomycetota bacterium]